jgi:spoIIIJ-associated protein
VAETLATDAAMTEAESSTDPDGAVATVRSAGTAEARSPAGVQSPPPPAGVQSPGDVNEDLLVQEGDVAGDYLERLLDLVDYDGDIDLDVEAGRAIVSIDGGDDLAKLVGPRGVVLEALQELTRLAVQQQTGARSRLMLDIAQWRSARRSDLGELGRTTAQRVLEGGEPIRLQPMTPFERKIVHDAVSAVEGVHSESEGEEPQRRVVVFPSS